MIAFFFSQGFFWEFSIAGSACSAGLLNQANFGKEPQKDKSAGYILDAEIYTEILDTESS